MQPTEQVPRVSFAFGQYWLTPFGKSEDLKKNSLLLVILFEHFCFSVIIALIYHGNSASQGAMFSRVVITAGMGDRRLAGPRLSWRVSSARDSDYSYFAHVVLL